MVDFGGMVSSGIKQFEEVVTPADGEVTNPLPEPAEVAAVVVEGMGEFVSDLEAMKEDFEAELGRLGETALTALQDFLNAAGDVKSAWTAVEAQFAVVQLEVFTLSVGAIARPENHRKLVVLAEKIQLVQQALAAFFRCLKALLDVLPGADAIRDSLNALDPRFEDWLAAV